MYRVQLETNHPVESSAMNRSPCRVYLETGHPVERPARRSHFVCRVQLLKASLQIVQLQTNHTVESSATNRPPCREISQKKSPCREFSSKQITLWRIQLQTNRPVEKSARRSCLVESSATKKPFCRELSCKQITCRQFSYKQITL